MTASSVGADAHADHESVAGAGHERGLSLEEETVQRTGAGAEKLALAPWTSWRRQELLAKWEILFVFLFKVVLGRLVVVPSHL